MQDRKPPEQIKVLGAVSLPLRFVLVVPWVAQTILIVGLVGYLSYRAGEQALTSLVDQLMAETGDRVSLYVKSSIEEAEHLNQLVSTAIEQGDIDMDLSRASPQRDRYLWRSMQMADSVSRIALGTPDGHYHSITRVAQASSSSPLQIVAANAATNGQRIYYNLTDQGVRADAAGVGEGIYEVRSRPWYEQAVAANQLTWSNSDPSHPEAVSSVTASAPVYNVAGSVAFDVLGEQANTSLRGVVAVDLSLQNMNRYLSQTSVGVSGSAVVLDPQGQILAASTDLPVPGTPESSTLLNTDVPLLQAAGEALYPEAAMAATDGSEDGSINGSVDDSILTSSASAQQLIQFGFDQERYFVKGIPLSLTDEADSFDWTLVAVVPASEFFDPIRSNRLRTLILCLVALGGAIATGALIARWIVSALTELNQSTNQAIQGLSHGNLEVLTVPETVEQRPDEVGRLARSWHHLSDQIRQTLSDTQAERQRLAKFLDAIPVGIAIHHADSSLIYINPAGRSLVGAEAQPAGAASPSSRHEPQPCSGFATSYALCHAKTRQPYAAQDLPLTQALRGHSASVTDLALQQDGQIIPLEVTATPIVTAEGSVEYAVVVFQDISERQRSERDLERYSRDLEQQAAEYARQLQQEVQGRQAAEQKLKQISSELEYLAKTDNLTQTANRRRFNERLMEEWQRQTRAQAPLSLLLIDVDEFKSFNDSQGHQQGDRCLILLARALNQAVKRPADVVARYGGEEFAVLLPETDVQGAIVVAERIRWMIKRANVPHDTSSVSPRVTVSIGIASTIPALGMMQNTLLTEADRMLYRAKVLGRDRYEISEFGTSPSSSNTNPEAD